MDWSFTEFTAELVQIYKQEPISNNKAANEAIEVVCWEVGGEGGR